MSRLASFITLFYLALSSSLTAQKVFNKTELQALPMSAQPSHTVYLIGDAGDDIHNQSGVDIMTPMLAQDPEATVVFLGDNIYPRGLHSKNHPLRSEDEARILHQMEPVKEHPGQVLFIPGNHDWEQGGKDGRDMIKRQQKYIEAYFDEDDAFMPDKGCPGPKVIEMGELSIIVIDTQWWLHKHERSLGESDGCDVLDEVGFMAEFKEALKKNRTKHVLVVGHHPLKSNGEHGGRFPLKQHIFPLTSIDHDLYVPLPVIGSIFPLYRRMLGDIQDIPHPIYTEMANSLLDAMNEYENVVYACGHEHNLQYFKEKQSHLVISGAGSKVTHVGNSNALLFGAERKGFARLNYFEDGRVWLEYYSPDAAGQAELLFSQMLYTKQPLDLEVEAVEERSYAGMQVSVVGDSSYVAGAMERFFMGELNRPLWTRPITVPYLDIHSVKGGLTPIKLGGGQQSKSIRMQGGDGHQYVVRQIQKNARFLVSKELRNTMAQQFIYDGIAGSHPYASIVIPRLSDPLGIYHTNPELVYLPDDPLLGDLQADFGGTFCLFEERPDDDMSHEPSFGRSDKVISYGDLIEKVHEKKSHQVDERFVLRNRLFDMLIGDWDRHDDQWRWARFEEGDLTFYRPIPRDRDQAFFKFDGLLPSIANRKWVVRKFQNFDTEIRDIKGLNFNARYFDRSWMTQMDRSDWKAEAEYLQQHLSTEDIDASIALFPDTAETWNGDFLRHALQVRKENLVDIAMEYYDYLAQEVDVVGKLDDDLFEVIRHADGRVEVTVTPMKKGEVKEELQFYHRIFHPKETKEIRLYGLDGEDVYRLEGESEKKSVLVRIIGGEEEDKVFDTSSAPGISRRTRYYDDVSGNQIESQGELKVELKKEKNALLYNRKSFIYNTYSPLPYFGYNPDDAVYLGAGLGWVTYGFDKKPYKSQQEIKANYAFRSEAYNVEYAGHFVDVLGPLDFGLDAQFNRPFVFQYNGAGNETQEIPLELSSTRINRAELRPFIGVTSKSGSSRARLVFHADNWSLSDDVNEMDEDDEEDDIDLDDISIPITDDTFVGLGLSYSYENVDDEVSPHRGIRFHASVDKSWGVEDPSEDSLFFAVTHPAFAASTDIEFTRWHSDLALYFPLDWMPLKTTLALRSGVTHNDGDFNFYQAAFIGGQNEFRGVRRNRYAGGTAQYNNAELRIDIKRIHNYALPFRLGVMGHADLGRVWLEGEDSDLWHNSFGGGIYLNLLRVLTINATYSRSDSGDAILVQGGFLF